MPENDYSPFDVEITLDMTFEEVKALFDTGRIKTSQVLKRPDFRAWVSAHFDELNSAETRRVIGKENK